MKRNLSKLVKRIRDTQTVEINCSVCLDRVSEYVDLEQSNEDPAARMPEVKQHLDQCGVCWDEYVLLRDLVKSEAEGTLPTTEELAERLKRQSE